MLVDDAAGRISSKWLPPPPPAPPLQRPLTDYHSGNAKTNETTTEFEWAEDEFTIGNIAAK